MLPLRTAQQRVRVAHMIRRDRQQQRSILTTRQYHIVEASGVFCGFEDRKSQFGNLRIRGAATAADHAVICVFLPNRHALPSIYSDIFEDENFILRHSRAGLLSMVSVGPDSNGSVFLITFVRSRQLDDKQVVFGELIDGWDTLDEIEKAGSVTGMPLRPITIDRCGPVWRGPALLSFQYYK